MPTPGYSLGTGLNEWGTSPQVLAAGDSPHVPAVWDGPLMSNALRGGGVSLPALFLRALVFRPFMLYEDPHMRINAHTIAR